MILIPCTFKCDHFEDGSDCPETVTHQVELVARNSKSSYEFKIRLSSNLPDGWISEVERYAYDSTDNLKFYCATHGKKLQPWRY